MKINKTKSITILGIIAVFFGVTAEGCSGTSTAQDKAIEENSALQGQVYNNKNNVEFNNYNDRQKIADDPTTILWCTMYPQNPNVKPITFPIVGKLTSSLKRPYATTQVLLGSSGSYIPEIPGPDHMLGASTEYRYGFTPAHVYADFTDMPSMCLTEPTTYQAAETTIVLKSSDQLKAAAAMAREALKQGQQANGTISQSASDKAQQILENATAGAGK